MGIRHLVVLINKMDDIQWNRDRYFMILSKLKPFL
jgi:translation elongation factor EF-1alpha